MSKKKTPKKEIEIAVTVELVDINTVPPAQAVAMYKARELLEKSFRKAEEKARMERIVNEP
jgi:hypothetical protein